VKCGGRSNEPLGRRKKRSQRRQTGRRMMMTMMAVHRQFALEVRTIVLRSHLPPPKRCLLGPVIQTLGVLPHHDVMGPEWFQPLWGRIKWTWSPSADRSFVSASPFVRDSYLCGYQGRY
jgi:hypothetical protein